MEKVQYNRNMTVYIDVCHNESGIRAVINELTQTHPGKSIRVACAFSKLKEIRTMIDLLLKHVKSIHFLASPHFKLESIANMYVMAQEVVSEL